MTTATDSRRSFFSIAAWYGLVMPFIAGVTLALLGSSGFFRRHDNPLVGPDAALDGVACILISSLVMSVISLFGISRHGASVIIWKALLGTVASVFFYFVLVSISIGRLDSQF